MEMAEGNVDVDNHITARATSKSDASKLPPTTSTPQELNDVLSIAQGVRGESEPPNVACIVLNSSKETAVETTNTSTKRRSPSTLAQSRSSPSSQSAQAPNVSEMTGPSPYGTRSRNRTGSTRPNYAEDREPEMDYEWASKTTLGSSSGSNIPQSVESDKTPTSSSRRPTATPSVLATAKVGSTSSATPKDIIPGMSTFSVNSDAGTNGPSSSKKRKAPNGTGNAVTTLGNSFTHAHTRKANHSALSAGASRREANMFSFEMSQGYLKHGKLKADDGTLFALNGRDPIFLY